MMSNDPFRPVRLRWDELREPNAGRGRQRAPVFDADPTPGTLRFLGRVTTSGTAPDASGRVFLVHPIRLSGPEVEASGAGLITDSSRTIPVVVVGSRIPKVDDLLIVFSVGGRWVAELGEDLRELNCDGCLVPRTNLTLSWSNRFLGPGSAVLTFDGIDTWSSGCINQLIFRLRCHDGVSVFQASYYVNAPCPTGSSQSCSSPGQSPLGLTPTQTICSPFLRRYTVSSGNCPVLWSQGFTLFTVSL